MNLDRCKVIPLADILQSPDGEKTFHDTTNELSCPLNPAVEHFLISTALTNQKIGISRTNLVVLPKDMHQQLVGYYSLALQVLDLDRITSKSLRKKITGFKRENKLPRNLRREWTIRAILVLELRRRGLRKVVLKSVKKP